MKLVSIITPCYNGSKYLDNYFIGILSQDYANIELIFVNDGSTDDTEKKALRYGEKLENRGIEFKYIYKVNGGQASAINSGLKYFKGDYLMWMDSDDILLPNNISRKVKFLEENKEYGFVQNGIAFVDESDINSPIGENCDFSKQPDRPFFENLIYSKNLIWVPGTTLVRKQVLMKSIPNLQIFESREGQNWQLLLPISYHSTCGFISEPLLKCVTHKDSHSRQKRNLSELITRENNFITLCSETVKNIPGMSNEEQRKWLREIEITHKVKIAEIASSRLNLLRYIEAKHDLKKLDYELGWQKGFLLFIIKAMIRKLSNL